MRASQPPKKVLENAWPGEAPLGEKSYPGDVGRSRLIDYQGVLLEFSEGALSRNSIEKFCIFQKSKY